MIIIQRNQPDEKYQHKGRILNMPYVLQGNIMFSSDMNNFYF